MVNGHFNIKSAEQEPVSLKGGMASLLGGSNQAFDRGQRATLAAEAGVSNDAAPV